MTFGHPKRILVIAVLVWASVSIVTFLLPPLLPEIRAGLSITHGQTGIALTLLYAAYGIFQYPGGRLSDAWTRAALIFPSIAILALGSFLIGTAKGFIAFLVACAVLGLARGLLSIPMRVLLSDLFPEKRGKAIGFFTAGTDVGGVIAAGVAIVVLYIGVWQAPFFAVAVLLAVLGVLFLFWSREPWRVSQQDIREADLELLIATRTLFETSELRWLIVSFSLFTFMVNGVLNFLPEFLQESKALSPQLAGGVYALIFVFGIVVKPTSGSLSDRFPRRTVAIIGMVIGAVSLALLLVVESLWAIVVLIVCFTIGYKSQFPIIDAILIEGAPDGTQGRDLGVARSIFHGLGAMGPAFVGLVADRLDFIAAFVGLSACLLVSAVILTWQR